MEIEGARSGVAHFTHNAMRIVVGSCFGYTASRSSSECLGRGARWSSHRASESVIETIAGPLIVLGLFTRPVAFILAGEMAVAYFTAHLPRSFWPIMSRGELPALYCFVYLFFAANGAGASSLDGLLQVRRRSREAG